MKQIMIYTDGACSGNPGPGGWGAILMYREHAKEISGYVAQTTNNRMELTAAIEALSQLKEPCEVALYTDSSYLCDGFNKGWMAGWKRRGWKKADGKPAENIDLWQRLDALSAQHSITWHKVKGHSSNAYNNRCDALATGEVKKHRQA